MMGFMDRLIQIFVDLSDLEALGAFQVDMRKRGLGAQARRREAARRYRQGVK